MAASGVRVVPPYRSRGLASLSVLAGALGFSTLMAYLQTYPGWLLLSSPTVQVSTSVGAVLLPPAVLALILGRITHRIRPHLVAALGYAAGFMVASVGVDVYQSADAGARASKILLPSLLVASVVVAALMTGLFLGVRWLVRALWFQTAEKTDLMCVSCGYDRGSEAITRCPECGMPADCSRFRLAFLLTAAARLQRLARYALPVTVILTVIAAGWFVLYRTLPVHRFYERFVAAGGTPGPGYVYSCSLGLSTVVPAAAVSVPVKGDLQGRALVLSYLPESSSAMSAMNITVAVHDPTTITPDVGTEWVYMILDREQANRIIRNGLPPGLAERLLKEADALGWKPNPGRTATVTPHVIQASGYLEP
jgi:hypothetical protein